MNRRSCIGAIAGLVLCGATEGAVRSAVGAATVDMQKRMMVVLPAGYDAVGAKETHAVKPLRITGCRFQMDTHDWASFMVTLSDGSQRTYESKVSRLVHGDMEALMKLNGKRFNHNEIRRVFCCEAS